MHKTPTTNSLFLKPRGLQTDSENLYANERPLTVN